MSDRPGMSDRREAQSPSGARASAAGAAGSPAPPMFTEAQIRKLKAAVVIMTGLLVLGFALVIFRIIQLAGRSGHPLAAAPPAAMSAGPDVALALPAGAVVRQVALSGNRLVVHYEAAGGGGIAIVDLTGGGVQRVRLSPSVGGQ